MNHKLSLIVLGGSGSRIKQLHLSKRQFMGIAAMGVFVFAAMAYGVIDYLCLHSKVVNNRSLERELTVQGEEVLLQRQQIQKFAQEINELKDSIVDLNKFEERIRILANINQPNTHDGLFGVGGSAPEDLNPEVELNQSHSQLMKEMHQQVNHLGDAAVNQQITFTHLLSKLEDQKNLLAHTPAIRPTQGWITSNFANRYSPFTGKPEFHKGIDIANQHGTPIIATADGLVSFVGESGSLGMVVVIDHGYGYTTYYGHIKKGIKDRGERVQRGEVIALMGNSGRSTGPHLHYEVHLNGVPINPENFILN